MKIFCGENAPMLIRRSDTSTHKASFKDLNLQTESWEQIAQDRAKGLDLTSSGAGEYEDKKNQRSRAETCSAESQS